ncbi:MAG: CoA-acylating methylmalonate-semialdehyde dehydrogenase [bacterium]
MAVKKIKNYVNGKWVQPKSKEYRDVLNPVTDQPIAQLPVTSKKETDAAIEIAQEAFWGWRKTPALERARLLMKLKVLMDEHHDEIARVCTEEHGKTFRESWTETERAIENVEVATGVTSLMMGRLMEDVAPGIDEYSIRQPLGVTASLNPFNFPAMIPFWSMPYALACGNSVIVKSSSQVPLTMVKIFELIDQVGFPKGVVNLVNGSHDVADALMGNGPVKAVSFVGSTPVGKYVYETCAKNGKRVQVQAGAKNFGIVMPDAKFDRVIPNIAASAFDCAGQRCLALASIIAVGDAYDTLKSRIVGAAKKIRLGDGLNKETGMGPVVSKKAKASIENWIQKGIDEGAKAVLDGRGVKVKGYPKGYWIGPTILDECTRDMEVVNEEIFGPVMCILRAKDLDEALDIIHKNRYGNAAAIYTQSGEAARRFRYSARCGNLGINIGVAAPMAFFHFGGSKDSFFGDLHAQSPDAFTFFTDRVVVVERWY